MTKDNTNGNGCTDFERAWSWHQLKPPIVRCVQMTEGI
uniref:Uncharacterized protein n=1 Tax=Anguilla anguilla TaxID=7936 RepID=A0A0E9WFV7_ANGAN